MAEYIERETFLKDIKERYCLPCKEAGRDHNGCKCDVCWVDDMRGDVIDAPAADVAPVVHGRWINPPLWGIGVCACSNCKDKSQIFVFSNGEISEKFCPLCGATMDGDSYAKAD